MSFTTTTTTTPSRPTTRRVDPLVPAMVALLAADLVGGLLAVSSELNTWGEAWGSKALLAAPLPMIGAQILLTVLAIRLFGRTAAVPAGLLAAACLASVISGFLDGGIGNDELTPALSAYQVFLLGITGVVGVLAARRTVKALRD